VTERRIISWTPAPPARWRARLVVALSAMPPRVRRLRIVIVARLPLGSRLRSHLLGVGMHAGWQLFNAERFETLLRFYDPAIEIIWSGDRKLFDMPDRFTQHAGALRAFEAIHQLASSGIDAEFRVVEILDAGGPCMAARLHMIGTWSRSATPIQQDITTIYTLAGAGVVRQVLMWDDRGDLAAELAAARDAAV
jgi:hypothetical protein